MNVNRRIQKLIDEADDFAEYHAPLSVESQTVLFQRRFAELIIEECAKMAEAFHNHQYDFTGDLELHEYMRKHFKS